MPPTRQYSYDLNFRNPAKQPPGTPLVFFSAARLSGLSVSNGNPAQFNVKGALNVAYVVQGSTNLKDWEPLATNASPFSFSDTESVGLPQRFYRAVYVSGQ